MPKEGWYQGPAAAVIPAPIAYIKVVAVKKLVVEVLAAQVLSHLGGDSDSHPLASICSALNSWLCE
jgi:hypothetical protein